MKPIWVSSGEPAGIGPDICLALAGHPQPLVILADRDILQARAATLKIDCELIEYEQGMNVKPKAAALYVEHVSCPVFVNPGQLNPEAARYVLTLLDLGVKRCLSGDSAALVTAPLHKAVINQAGIPFQGHTEYLKHLTDADFVLMMFSAEQMRLSLVTTHLPLNQVPKAITQTLLEKHCRLAHRTLQEDFGIPKPKIKIAGLNPHAGEQGYLGREEIDVIHPLIERLQAEGMTISGPYPADTLFNHTQDVDLFVCMYHDQGLPVLKYASFDSAVNISCGLPFIRTSVDHGTALEIAGSGKASANSLKAALILAASISAQRDKV